MTRRDRRELSDVVVDDGAIAELVHDGSVAGWLAVQATPFRNLFLMKQVGCWLLFTWTDGAVNIEEDYPPFALLPELKGGVFRSEDRRIDYEVRWVTDDRREDLWERYGVHEPPGYYMGLAAEQRGRKD